MFNPSSNVNWNHSNMYASSHLRTRLATSFQETQCPYLAVLLLICFFSLINVVPQLPPEYEPFNFPLAHSVRFLTACSESLRVFALLLTLRRWRITLPTTSLLLMVQLRAPEIHWRLLKSVCPWWPPLLPILKVFNLAPMSPLPLS